MCMRGFSPLTLIRLLSNNLRNNNLGWLGVDTVFFALEDKDIEDEYLVLQKYAEYIMLTFVLKIFLCL